MKKKIIVAFVCVIALVMSLTSCDLEGFQYIFEDIIENVGGEIMDNVGDEILDGVINNIPGLGEDQQYEELEAVMPGRGFEEVDISHFDLPKGIVFVYREITGMGYVFRVQADGYNPGMEIIVGIDNEGVIIGSKCLSSYESFGVEADLDYIYNGQTIGTFSPYIISGATYTSRGYSDAISYAFEAFYIITGREMDSSVKLQAMISELAPEYADGESVYAPGSILKATIAKNGIGASYIVSDGDECYLVLVNAMGRARVYDDDGDDVTSANKNLAAEAKKHAGNYLNDYSRYLTEKVYGMFPEATNVTAIETDTFNTVSAAVTFTVNGERYYGFYSRCEGFNQMDIYVILDSNGAIAKVDVKQILFDIEYAPNISGVPSGYKDRFVGATIDTWSDDTAIISYATISSNAMSKAVRDSFEAFDRLK